jgi:PPIC-type PPIASE domain
MIYRRKYTLVGLALIVLCLMGLNHPARSEAPSSETLVYVDKATITVGEFEAELARRAPHMNSKEQMEALLDEMVRFEMIYAAAIKSGYDKDPQILARFKRLMVNKYIEDVLEPRFSRLTVSDTEVKDRYKTHMADFVTSKRVRAAVIQIDVPAQVSKNKKAELLKRAKTARVEALKLDPATRSFGSVAVKYSDHQPTRYRGGDTGWLEAGKGDQRWPQVVNEAVFSLSKPGEVSPVITSPDGYYLVKLMETKESQPRPFVVVKERIRYELLTEKKAQVERGFYEELKAKVPVQVDRARLGAIETSKGDNDKEAKQPPGLPGQ